MLKRSLQLYRKSFQGLSRSVWLLSLITLINRSGTMVIPFMTIYLTAEMHFTMAQAGWVMACFGLGSVVGSYAGGKLTDIIGYHQTCFWSLLISGALFIVLLFMDSYWEICACIFVLSIFADAFRPAMFSALAIFSVEENRTRSISLIRLAINLGFSIGPTLGGIMAATAGYQWLFIADGVTCMAAAVLFYFVIPANIEGQPDEQTAIKPKAGIKVYQDRPYMAFLGLNLLMALIFMQLIYAVPVYYKQFFLMSEGEIGLLMGMNGLIIAFLEMPMIYQLEKKRSSLFYVVIGSLLIGLGFFIFVPLGKWIGAAWISMLFLTFGEILKMPFANAFAMERSNEKNRGTYMGWYSMAFSLSMIASPVVGMQIAEHYGFSLLWILLGIFSTLAAACYWLLDRSLKKASSSNTLAVPSNMSKVH